jgi:hypothetical protein
MSPRRLQDKAGPGCAGFVDARVRLCRVPGALFGASRLALVLASITIAAAPRAGVTVLVHGFTPWNGITTSPFEYWGGNNGSNFTSLLERFGSGQVREYNPATGDYENITFRVPNGRWVETNSGHQILLFDWREGSDEAESGQAEAAADALFASLMEARPGGRPLISTSPYAALRPMHFIGHSRGTVVVSETVQRLGRYNIRVNYVTYLDIHDFGQLAIGRDEVFHDPAVQVWENVDYADAFYQENPPTMCGVNPAGRRLSHIPTGPWQRDLTELTRLGPGEAHSCSDHDRPHAWIKEYYWGTVATNGGSFGRPSNWYTASGGNGTGQGFGFDRWWRRGGFEQGPDSYLSNSVRCVVASDAVPYVASPPDENNGADRNDVPPVLFNGDFDLPDLDGGIGGTGEANSLAGWRYFGGGGSAFLRQLGQPGDFYLLLKDNALQARHNRFFLPPEARELWFGRKIDFVPSLPAYDHVLEVRIGSTVVRRLSVNEATGDFVAFNVNLRNFPELLGRVNTLTFELDTTLGTVSLRTAEVRLDNINVVTDSTAWIHSFYRFNPSNWRLIWRSWPSGTFYLQSSSNLINWATIDDSGIDSTAGSFNIPYSGVPSRYFRGRVIPAR